MKRHDLTRYGMAAILTTCLCLPAVWQTVAYPSVSDVWCYGMVAMLSIAASCASLRAQQWPRPHALDAIVLLWALYMACNYWFLSPYPATEDFREADTLKSPPSRGSDAPHVHPRLRKRPLRCTLDCAFKTSES